MSADVGQILAGNEVTLANPVERVDWKVCDSLLSRHGLLLLTEAQWEYACRAGSTTPWLCVLNDLKRYANLADATMKRTAPSGNCEVWTDGYSTHARVGSFLPNVFGLYGVHGNVWEWCLDEYGSYSHEVRPGDGLRVQGNASSNRCDRGGSFNSTAPDARSADRYSDGPSFRGGYLGCRPARAVRLPD